MDQDFRDLLAEFNARGVEMKGVFVIPGFSSRLRASSRAE